ncbi:MAG: tetratricopeptide repeat protein [Lewinellaceae bacterium]|nr:tetratricopeptide repeat protein [Lewinellaceae bacterium]
MSKPKKKIMQQPAAASQPRPADELKGFPAWFSNTRMMRWALFAFSFLLYANTLLHDYALDDAIVIYDNMFVQDGVSGIPGILAKDTFYGFFKEAGKANLVAGGRYRPLTLVLFALEHQLFGKSPFMGHLINGLLYGLTVMVLYLLLLQLFRPAQGQVRAYFIAFAASLLFAAHPIHTEVVANIKGADEIVALLGSLAALYFSLRAYWEKKTLLNVWAGLVFFLGLLSKENAITFLAVAPLAYYFFTKASAGKIVQQSLPLVAAAGAFLVIRYAVMGWGIGEPVREMMNNPFIKLAGNQYVDFTAAERLATVLFTLGKYVQLLFFPLVLTHDYYPRQIGVMNFSDFGVLLSLLVYVALGVYALLRLPKKDPVSFAILYFLATLSIVSNLFFPIGTHMAERLAFMPSVGFCLALAILGYRWARRNTAQGKQPGYRQLTPVLTVLAIVALAYSGRALVRNMAWKDNYTLFTTDILNSPNSAKLQNAVGGELITQAVKPENDAQRPVMLQEAVGHLEKALKIHPNYKNAYLLLGNAYNYLKEYEKSVDAYQKALSIDPEYADARRNLGITYRDAGRYYGEQKGNLSLALDYLNKAYEIIPKDYDVLRLLGVANGLNKNPMLALEYFTLASEQQPENAEAWWNLHLVHTQLGNTGLSEQYRKKAMEMDPKYGVQMPEQ